jgi:Uma2 family endonuclease
MAEPRRNTWTWDAYLDWEAGQPIRYELVEGQVHAMGGGTLAHDVIANNLRRELATQLRGGRCRPYGPDVKVATGTGNARYPDALIDCGRFLPDALQAQEPIAVFEVLSKSTAWVDQNLKLRDYDATQTIKHYVLISQDEPRVMVYTRGDDGRLDLRGAMLLTGMGETVALPGASISLPLARFYEGIEFEPAPA